MSIFQSTRSLCTSCRHYQFARFASSTAALSDHLSGTIDRTDEIKKSRVGRKRTSRTKAQTRGPAVITRPKVLSENKIHEYLQQLEATKDNISLEDLERLRPARYSEPGSPEYAQEYNDLLDTITRSFSVKQLRTFLDMYGTKPSHRQTKWTLATLIMENQWGWPSLTEIQRNQRDWSEVESKSKHRVFGEFFGLNGLSLAFLLQLDQLFLILGKDGRDLLGLSTEYNVHISFSSSPFSLKAEGLRGALRKLEERLKHIQKVCFLLDSYHSQRC
jgi:hypothetical protein